MIVPITVTPKKGSKPIAILSPSERRLFREHLLIKNKPKDRYLIVEDYLFHTGMRMVEAKYIYEHQDCFREGNGTIFLPTVEGMGKDRCTIHGRQIMLAIPGIAAVKRMFECKFEFPPYQNIEEVFKRAARDAGIDPTYIVPKITRKECVSYLMACFPERQEQIAFSAGHDYNTMRIHYLTFGWRKEDIREMRDLFNGWGEA